MSTDSAAERRFSFRISSENGSGRHAAPHFTSNIPTNHASLRVHRPTCLKLTFVEIIVSSLRTSGISSFSSVEPLRKHRSYGVEDISCTLSKSGLPNFSRINYRLWQDFPSYLILKISNPAGSNCYPCLPLDRRCKWALLYDAA